MNKPKILITGGKGKMGSIINRYMNKEFEVYAPGKNELDVLDIDQCKKWSDIIGDNTVIHLAAYTNVLKAETERKEASTINIIGTENVIRHLVKDNTKAVYLSTDYVFDGKKGNYNEKDIPCPLNHYGITKLLGEFMVGSIEKHLTIRTSFKLGFDKYKSGYIDMFTSAEHIMNIASEVVTAIILYIHDKIESGVLHIGGERKSMWDLIRKYNPNVSKDTINNHKGVVLPRDCSLDTNKWNLIKIANGLI